MITIPNGSRVYLFHDPVSFHRQIDGLCTVCRQQMAKDPIDGAYFLFISKMGASIRVLHYDGSSFWLSTRRLRKGSFRSKWPRSHHPYSLLSFKSLWKLLCESNEELSLTKVA